MIFIQEILFFFFSCNPYFSVLSIEPFEQIAYISYKFVFKEKEKKKT